MHHDLLLTGHEDGTIRFWDASTISLKFLYKLDTANLFDTDADANGQAAADGEEEWPPFRKVRKNEFDYLKNVYTIYLLHSIFC